MISTVLLAVSLAATPTCSAVAPVPDLLSPHPLWCLPTSVAAVLHSHGQAAITPRELARNVTMYRDGTTMAELGKELDRRGLVWLAWQGPLDLVPALLALGVAPIAVSQKAKDNHAVVLDGGRCCRGPEQPCAALRAMDPATGTHLLVDPQAWTGAAFLLVDVTAAQGRAVEQVLAGRARVLARGQVSPQ